MNIHGFKKQQGQAQKPHIAKDDLVSVSYANILYGLGEGEIMGLSDGGKSIKLDGTPLINDNGQPNFTGVNWEFRTGTLDQSHIAGFPAVENETNVGVELRSDRPFVRAINNRELSAVRVRLNFNSLREQKDNGDVVGYAVSYAIDVQTDGGSFVEVLTDTVRGKSSQGYKKSHRIDLPNAGTAKRWTIRVRRITPNRNSDLIADTVHIDALTEIIDAKLAYPCTALLGLSYDAKTFTNIAKIAVRLKGKIIQVPSNYNADTRTYNGLWDGTFKPAYSNNPAWVYYDLCTHKRYGLGERLSGMVDKWRLYQIGQYCDELVDDGKGGQEPRFTVNVYIQKADDAYKVLQNLASVFRGLSFWDGQNIIVDSDTPKEAVYTFSPANVVGGEFAYTGTRARDRHTLAKVAWDNPDNGFNTEYELIPDEGAIARYGVKVLDIAAFGCTSQGQAQRAGLWALKAEQLETQTVSFKTGLQGFIPQVGQVINVADNVFAGRAISGKIVALSTDKRQITLDRVAGKVGDTLTVNGTDGVQSAKIVSVRDTVLTLDKAVNAQSEHIWAVISDDLKLKQFRILTIAQNDDATFDITALEYNAQKYKAVDNGAIVTPQPYTVLNATPITAPNSVTLTASTRTVQGQAVTTLTINWEQVQGATAYIVKWRKDDGNWQTLPKVSGQSVDIEGIYAGNYTAQVQAIDAFDNESLSTSSQLTNITGKTGKPPRLASLTVRGVLFGMNLEWVFNKGSDDTNFTEIQVSPDGRSNITTLGTFAYPTNKHEITGLQGNLTQFYRARIVDKLGNTSDWTAWVSGTTEARADKVLDILSGQINQSHLDQTLRTPIAKIGGIETDLNGVKTQIPSLQSAISTINGQLPTLNTEIANAKRELQTAQSTLNTAVANITTERNRINTAIRDITALQSANTAKTQELANLTQTAGSHTSSIRELGVTTGDLTQKYSQLKTASDTANSEIIAIKQTQNGQATSIERLGAKFDNLAVGGRNLLKNSSPNVTNANYSHRFELTTAPNVGDEVVVTLWGELGADRTGVGVYNTHGYTELAKLAKLGDGVYQAKFTWRKPVRDGQELTPNDTHLNVYFYPNTATSVNRIERIKLERGNVGTDWTPAPEDLQADIDSKATTANLENLRQTLTTADTALSEQITAMDTAYKSADRQLTANLASETTARTTADAALGQRIDSLQSDYNGNKANVANQLKTLSDKDTATASQISQLTANVSTANTKADTATTKADNAQNTANNALNRANTANSAITAEQKARADADSALSQRISALDATYQKSDTDITARLAREEAARATGDNANAQALRTLESTVNGIGGRVGTSESKIATLERTTSDLNGALATAQSQLNARFDGLSVGGRNLLKNSSPNINNANYSHRFELSTAPSVGDEVVVTLWGELGADRTGVGVYNTQGYNELFKLVKIADGVYQGKGTWKLPMNGGTPRTPNDTHLNVYFYPSSGTSVNRIDRIKLERGNVATDWTPAPEDSNVDLSPYATIATLDEYKQTQAAKDTANAQKLSQLESGLGGKASSVALDTLTTKVNQVDGKLTAESQKITQMQSSIGSQTASIRNVEQSVNGVKAIKAVTVDNNGFISGYGLMSELQNGRVTSRFGINADQIYFGATTSAKKPFVLNTRPTTIDGVSYPAGAWFNTAHIANASIKLAHIDKASIGSLSALSADIGTLTTRDARGSFTYTGSKIELRDPQGRLLMELGLL
ncbi:phage tail protein [Moraxella sp.]|uniref:TipJ family phage tail tip protein n=1 Tax=Moraxella sp. TaxID=479 RepID=UPI0026DA9F75|nr:phage tail protein [Moraxella sp.]MDO4895654.1 phage tail protein [Moraxella sp.]